MRKKSQSIDVQSVSDAVTVDGGVRLEGRVDVQGSKNAVHKLLPATVLFPGVHTLDNYPRIQDSLGLLEVVEELGGIVRFPAGTTAVVDTRDLRSLPITPEVAARSTGTVLFTSALLSRFGQVNIGFPGGDRIGSRPIDRHLDALRSLGAAVRVDGPTYTASTNRLTGGHVRFAKDTVNGTANAILAAACANGQTVIDGASRDPDVENLLDFLEKVSVPVSRGQGGRLTVTGIEPREAHVRIAVYPDRNDAATFMIAAAATGGTVEVCGVKPHHLEALTAALNAAGADVSQNDGGSSLTVESRHDAARRDLELHSAPFPGFATDWGPMFHVLMTQTPGNHRFHETIFSRRFDHLRELNKLGARIELLEDPRSREYGHDDALAEGSVVSVSGPTPLRGGTVVATNVRATAALLIAGLVGSAPTRVLDAAQYLAHGYVALEERMANLGARLAS